VVERVTILYGLRGKKEEERQSENSKIEKERRERKKCRNKK